jgi:hypothetical protein
MIYFIRNIMLILYIWWDTYIAYLHNLFLLPTLIRLNRDGTTCFSSCCDKDFAIIFTTGRLPDVNPP